MATRPIEKEDDWSESSDDEIEDEEGDLATENIDSGINKVLNAIRNNDPALKDKSQKFFPEIGEEGVKSNEQHKPVFLKDYQRQQILDQASDDESKPQNGEDKPETYAEEQERVRKDLIKGFGDNSNSGNEEDEEEDDDLLQKREGPERELPEVSLPDPDQDANAFLDSFLNQRAWIPTKKNVVPTYSEVTKDDEDQDSDEFDDLSEKFENAYNFRFEDPNAAEIVSYARDQSTLRRSKMSSRQKRREREHQEREKEEEKRKLEVSKMRKEKVSKVTSKLEQLQQALGEGEDKVAELLSQQDLEGDWDDAEWDKRMQKLFDDEFYGRDDGDVDVGAANADVDGEDVGEDVDADDAGARDEEEDTSDKKSKKSKKNKKNAEEPHLGEQPLSRKDLKRKAEKFVDANDDLIFEKTIKPTGFKYREVDPENFGLTSRDILLASDKELNQFAGLKKLASYRDRSKMDHDRKKYAKRKRLRQWRKDVFGTEEEPTNDQWEKAKSEAAAETGEPVKPKKAHKSKSGGKNGGSNHQSKKRKTK